MNQEKQLKELQAKYPNWLIRFKNGKMYGFCNLKSCITDTQPETEENSFLVAVRVTIDGVFFFSKKKEPDLYYLQQRDYLTLDETITLKNDEIHAIKVGERRVDGMIYFLDCIYEPGIHEEDYLQLRNLYHEILQIEEKTAINF